MAVNFGLLQQAAPVSAFFQGQQDIRAEQDRNVLRQQQAQQLAMQQENALALRESRMALAEERRAAAAKAAESQGWLSKVTALFESNNMPLNLQTARQGQLYAIRSGNKEAVEMMNRTVQALEEREALAAAFGPQAAAPDAAPVVAPAVAPTNALAAPPQAPAPVVAPAVAPAAGVSRERLQAIIADPNAPKAVVDRAKVLLTTLPKEPSAPTAIQEFEAFQKMTPEQQAAYLAHRTALQPKPAQTTIKLPEQEKAFETELGKGQAKKLLDDKAVAEDAASIIGTVQQGRQLLQSGMITGFGAEALTQIGAALNQAGISFAADSVANTQAFAANMAQNVGRIIKQFGAGTGLSNADREYAEKMAGGKITLDRKSIERILDINERAARNVISSYNKRASSVKTNVPLTIEMPAAAPPPAAPSERPSLQDIFQPKR